MTRDYENEAKMETGNRISKWRLSVFRNRK